MLWIILIIVVINLILGFIIFEAVVDLDVNSHLTRNTHHLPMPKFEMAPKPKNAMRQTTTLRKNTEVAQSNSARARQIKVTTGKTKRVIQ
jgi:hypothetical protein